MKKRGEGRIGLPTHTNAQCFCGSGLRSEQGSTVYIVLSGSVTNPEGRGRGEREDRRDGWMDRGKEEWRAGGLLCSSNNGNSGNAHPERLHIRVLESCCKLLLCNSDHHFIILLLMKICF